jgi:hypothetical protein
MDKLVILAILAGAAALVTALVLGMGAPKSVTLPDELLPSSIVDFEAVNRFAHVEPIFKGEEYSSLVSFAPVEGTEFAGRVERMGITVYKFKNRRTAQAAEELLLSSTNPQVQTVQLNGRTASSFADPATGQAGLIWQVGPILYEVFVTAPGGEETDVEPLKRAALAGAGAVLSLWERD